MLPSIQKVKDTYLLCYIDLQGIAKDAQKMVIYEQREFNIPILDKILKEKSWSKNASSG